MAPRTRSDVIDRRAPSLRRVRWSRLRWSFIDEWAPGEHVALIGPTGSGKSFLALDILQARASRREAHVVAFGTKRRDETLTALGWPIIATWADADWDTRQGRRVILWPSYARTSELAQRRRVFVDALDDILDEGNWTVYFDEAIYFVETLKMRAQLDEYWNTARSAGITVVSSSQGVSWVPKASLTQQRWVFAFGFRNAETRRDVANVLGDRQQFAPMLAELGTHEFVMVNTLTGAAYISRVGT